MTPSLSPPSDVVFIAVRFVSGTSVELRPVKRPVKFQPLAYLGAGGGVKIVENAFSHFQIVRR